MTAAATAVAHVSVDGMMRVDEPTRADKLVRVDELISAQVRRTPDAVAAVCGASSLSYLELEHQCERAAAGLRRLGVTRGCLVGIHLQRSLEMLVAVIAVMKAGGAYVPLDPDFPAGRLAHMVSDSGLGLVISEATLADTAPPGDHTTVDIRQLLDDAPGELAGADSTSDDNVSAQTAGPSDLIYVLYTSGSTGLPKGVALEHRNVVNFLLSMQREPGLTADDRLLAVTTLSFDIAGLELYLPLVTGARVVIANRDEAMDGERLRGLIDAHGITAMQATPTTWRLLIEAGWRGGIVSNSVGFKVLCGGEALPRDLARMLLQRCDELWNLYGPTETAIWSTTFRVVDGDAPVLIGRPIANTRVYVLDRSGRPVPPGIPGEICIAGAGVARGYLNRPELTAEKFVADPFPAPHDVPQAADGAANGARPGDAVPAAEPPRMYRTGDSGRFLMDGNLEFRNRIDNQVKVRGFRVELGEIEAALESHPSVKQAVARVFEPRPGDARLAAYILPHAAGADAPPASELRDHLRARLPHYMVPQHLSMVTAFPLTPNGKVDRAQLPAPQAGDLMAEVHVEPGTPTESRIVEVFRQLLAIDRVSADASFFDLGGHSILATRVVSQLRQDLCPDISLRLLFESPTAIELGLEIDRLRQLGHADPDTRTDADAAIEREAFQF